MNTPCKHQHHTHERALSLAVTIAFTFMVIEIVGGAVARSLALMSDALHLFADIGALSLSWIALQLMHKPATTKFSFGYKRAEVLGALASSLILWVLCGVLIYESVFRFFKPEPIQGSIVFFVAAFGLVANFIMFKLLHPTRKDNLNMRAAYLHIIGDLLGSFGVLLAGSIIWLTGWNLADPIISFLFACGMLFSSGKVLWQSLLVLMESTPKDIDPDMIHSALTALSQVEEVHDLHVWSLSSKDHALSVHLVAKNPQMALKAAHELLEKRFGIVHMTIQVEDREHFEPKYCYDYKKS